MDTQEELLLNEENAKLKKLLLAQTRELEIEAALEKVRSRAMAMQKSDELKEVIQLVYQQFIHLNIHIEHTGFLMDYKARDDLHIWLADHHLAPSEVTIPCFDSIPNNSIKEAKEKRKNFFKYQLDFEEKNKFYQDLFKFIPDVPEETLRYYLNCPGLAGSGVLLENIGLYIENFEGIPYTDEENNTLMRLGKVFQQTYTRFLDLQKAEAQAREAQIEVALEKVRSRTMAMFKSEELADAAATVFHQLQTLGIRNLRRSLVGIMNEEEAVWDVWYTTVQGESFAKFLKMPIDGHPIASGMKMQWLRKEKIQVALSGDDLKSWLKFIMASGWQYPKGERPPDKFIIYGLPFSNGYLVAFTDEDIIPAEIDLLQRFARVFDQTYTRFLDLQKAEAQAREANIEAALERVRSRTIAMQNSDELADLVATVFTELNRLGFALTGCIIWINNPELLTAEMWVASTEMNKPPEPYYIKPFRHSYFKSVIEAWKQKNKKWVYEMNGGEKKTFQQQFFNELGNFPTLMKNALEAPESVIYSASFYNFGALEIIGTEQVTDEKFEILHRLGKVFDMSYTRFTDLKQAEAQAREATIEAALERVRSRTLAMQKSDELAETSSILFRQLIHLGIAPNRLYIGIANDKNTDIEFWITDEDGSKVSTLFSGDAAKNISVMKMYNGWKQQKKSIVIDMHGKELDEYFHYLGDELRIPFQGGFAQKRRIQYISYFSKGFIGMASPDEQPEKTVLLLNRFAAVFNLTFTRFNDLKVAEAHALQAEQDLIEIKAARKKAEETLVELQSTQKQLIQSEKMASLGELTAGIAHEIQNPLNFVNNFSEVNKEMLEELKTERLKPNTERNDTLEDELINDVINNSEKINHHGKRAGDIVKGMLQHSRTSSGVKEPTDINALADEYLRLSYHGLRAKDKSFNATMKTDFDETLSADEAGIGKINIIPQDIGRVLLNLFNNAFYAVNEQKNKNHNSHEPTGEEGLPIFQRLATLYEPTVWVSTEKADGKILIKIKDNGNGIPKNIVDKIFQPFFTTKPTGQGTGLGLSLSYDIVKAHGGEIKVASKEGEGSEFIIALY